MTYKQIKHGDWYKTKAGVGQVIDCTTKWRPPMVKMKIYYPFPRLAMVAPRDVLEETVALPEGATEPPKEWA